MPVVHPRVELLWGCQLASWPGHLQNIQNVSSSMRHGFRVGQCLQSQHSPCSMPRSLFVRCCEVGM